METRVAVCGICGKTGALLAKKMVEGGKFTVSWGLERPGHPKLGTDFGKFLGRDDLHIPVLDFDDFGRLMKKDPVDVVVDFTSAPASVLTTSLCAKEGIQVVMGTTGFTPRQREDLAGIVRESGISMVMSSNYGIAANVMFKIVSVAAKVLGNCGFDVEIMDYHTRTKPDAPSGTAMTLGSIVSDALGWDLQKVGKYGRELGNDHPARPREEIGFHSLRSGCVESDGSPGIYLAENTVYFGGAWDRLDITIHDFGMEAIVPGVMAAVEFLGQNRNRGRVFSMLEVLGLEP